MKLILEDKRNIARHEHGYVMLMTLILLAVMAMGTAMAVRVSMNTDMVAHNLRNRQIAFQAAEAVLRYCERMVINNPSGTRVLANYRTAQHEWLVRDNWSNGNAYTVAPSDIGLEQTIRVSPQCLIRHFTMEEWREMYPPVPGTITAESRGFDSQHIILYRITARGFSPDYRDAPLRKSGSGYDEQNTRGSEVRLQSMVRSVQ